MGSNGWTGDVEDDDDGDDGEGVEEGFVVTLQDHVDEGTVTEISELEFVKNLDDIENASLLQQAYAQIEGTGNKEKANLVQNRLMEVAENDGTDDSDAEEAEDEGTEDEDPGDDDPDESDDSNGWGGSTPDEVEEEDEEDEEEDEEEVDPEEPAEPPVERLDETEGEDTEEIEGADPEPESALSEPSSGPPEPASGITPEEASELDRRWKIMVWGKPGLFKTHFAFTAPEPIAFIDLENKAHDIVQKFSNREIRIWQPAKMEAEPDTQFRRAKKALDEALEWLDWWYENEDTRGTIVVDSISLMWEWAQWHHKLENYPMKDPEDVELSANFGSSQESDWGAVKEYHNNEFRSKILDSPFHFVWTAMSSPDYSASLDSEDPRDNPVEAEGERNNIHKVDSALRARKNSDGGKVGDLTKSNYTDRQFMGLKRPTFPKFRDAIEAIEEAEASEQPVDLDLNELGIERIIRGDPQYYQDDDN